MILGDLKDGVVIDHIPAGRAMELYADLKLHELDCEIALIERASSKKYGRKDILKISDRIDLDYDILGFIDPRITVNIIRDGVCVEKVHPQLPERLTDVVTCKNPRCITSVEPAVPQVFTLTDRESGTYRCLYCETRYSGPYSFGAMGN